MALHKLLLGLGITTSLLSAPVFAFSSSTPVSLSGRTSSLQVSLRFPRTSDPGAPARTAGGGVRGDGACVVGDLPVTPLMPVNQATAENPPFLATTVDDNPTVYVYVPENDASFGEFGISDANGKPVYVSPVELPIDSRILTIELPPNTLSKTGEYYEWYFALVCDPGDRGADAFAEGFIQRKPVTPTLQAELAASADSPLSQAATYAENGIWQETLSIFANKRNNEYKQEWEDLLVSVGIDRRIVSVPFDRGMTAGQRSR